MDFSWVFYLFKTACNSNLDLSQSTGANAVLSPLFFFGNLIKIQRRCLIDVKVDKDLHRHRSGQKITIWNKFCSKFVCSDEQMSRCQTPCSSLHSFMCQITIICSEGKKPVAVMSIMLFKLFTLAFWGIGCESISLILKAVILSDSWFDGTLLNATKRPVCQFLFI